jgi:hypothetical protein
MKKFPFVVMITIIFLTACGAPIAAPVEEKYEQVDPLELSMDFQADIPGAIRWDADGNITEFGGGKVTRFTVGGKPIELVSDDLLLEGEEVFIVTKEYGKIKVTFNSNFTISLWLKPSQKEKFMELIK